MNKIVDKGIKIDLHIHSAYSQNKDGQKVANNTLANLNVLINGLTKNEVEMCAITDHDTFNYEIYTELKKEESKSNCIRKVLPGIEFSVEFSEGKIIHIVTLFDDKNESKVRNIEQIMLNGKGKTCYKKGIEAYTRKDYFDILQDINIDFIMIAHQKKTPSSNHKPHANDVMTLGKETFNELVFMDYFDAFEFRNKKNEIYNKAYSIENNIEDKLRFITGSDCHNWRNYPYTEEDEKTEFKFTYIKALPTFKGLAMAVTDNHRIELENSFFNPNAKYFSQLVIEIDGIQNIVPLSKGLNVIIGDNSIGKSLFLNAITNDCKNIDRRLRAGYDKYIEKNKLKFVNYINSEDIFRFNGQGEIRGIFDSEGLKPDNYLSGYYPNEINVSKYRYIVENELQKLYDTIREKFAYDEDIKKLPVFAIALKESADKGITFIENVEKIDVTELQKLVNSLENVMEGLRKISENKELSENERKHLKLSIEMFEFMKQKYEQRLLKNKQENEKINIFNTYIKNYKIEYNRKMTDEQSLFSEFLEQKENAVESIVALLVKKKKIKKYIPDISEIVIEPETNPVDKYRFVSKLQIERINNEYIAEILKSVLKKGKTIDTQTITETGLKEMIKKYSDDEGQGTLDVLMTKITAKLDSDFRNRNTIIEDGMDVYDEVSSGFDAQMYFTLLCGETRDKGIYIIDQPEDHISQRAIKERVLGQFRKMGLYRQVIMVTHNPQFIVNLDVDNVIFLSNDSGKFTIQSGALEYEDENYSILRIVADNIEGGLKTIQGRLKRYEKTYEFKEIEGKYILKNTNPNDDREAFEIGKKELQFDTNNFYQYVFLDINEKMEIEIINQVDETDKVAQRVYEIISEICKEVIERLNKKCFEEF